MAYESQCYENHAQDSRIKPIEVSDTRNQKDGTGGNNLPLVCFSKVSHPTAPNGEGERWDEREVAQTRNTFDNGEKRCQEVVVSMAQNTRDEVRIVSTAYKLDSTASNSMKSKNPHSGFHETQVAACLDTTSPDPTKNQGGNVIVSTNSNGGDVAATINANMSKLGGDNQTTFGGGVCHDTEPLGIGRDVFNSGANASFSPDIRVGVQPTLTARTTQGAVCARLKGDE